MPLPTLHWRYVGSQSFTSSSISGCLDAIYTLGTKVTYANGTTRTPGSGSAWTWTRQQIGGITEACIGAMPATNAITARYVIAGSTTSRAYTVLTPDAAAISNAIVHGMNRGAATMTGNWYDAQPFGSGNVGYWRSGSMTNPFNTVHMWENEECYVVQFIVGSTGQCAALGGGAFLDPRDTGSPAAESDGRLYGMWSTGTQNFTSVTFLSEYFPTTSGSMWSHATSSANAHCGILLPTGAGTTMVPVSRMLTPGTSAAMPAGQQTPNGKLPFCEDIPYNQPNSTVWGCWRAMAYTRQAITAQVWRLSGVEKGYYLGSSPSTNSHGIILLAN